MNPYLLDIGPQYRPAFDRLLRSCLAHSRAGRVLVLCEWNGDITFVGDPGNPTKKYPYVYDPKDGPVEILGPVTVEGFWTLHDRELIEQPAIVIIQAPLPRPI